VATLLFATFAFLVLTSRRTTAFLAACAAFAGSAAAVAVLLHADEFVDSPLGSAAAGDQAPGVATGVALACALTGAVWGLGTRLAASRGSSPPLVDRIVLAIVLAVGAGAVVAIDPVGRFEAFKNPISEYSDEYVRSHLLSSTGSGRWQFWEAAVDSFRSAPLTGRGAGSYEAWWAQHGSLAHFVRDAHSLYLESLAELGAAGGLLITLGLAAGIYGLATRVLRVTGDARASVAAAGGAFAGFVFAVGIDWMWELTVVGCIGMILLGLLTGPATMPPKGIRHGTGIKSQFRGPWLGSALAALAIGWALMIVMAIPLLAELQLGESQAAASRGDARAALTSAVRAARVEPWAATPYLQLALVQEQTGQVRRARLSIEQAIERDRSNWRLWLVAARIQTKLGDVAAAQTSFSRARTLNPRSPLFAPEGR
jgi:tetratricopeptide (TPR) repeat protein